ncbi:MAG: phosphoglycerate kinase [Sediminibacterium sp. Gen4]|jgi:phosphoglycerate kinase|uniref:phosphoglycerate kinase n=1 Tax=unclassified Sediminibacterium TaxID=2635961 RepID=UPI0015BB9403|nr:MULTISPECIES: phosphoglycerate kinase [unclassified Sediminibacterium]MBW0162496.1 phosphoglycerate kinase [Sediminibacterium sp.]MBW0165404.1 phosphoglycerate kinase [Sediminibacterium sp.]NWK65347.1 phosphoglycerate kinase [Sediminibacterium sp. Gen4]
MSKFLNHNFSNQRALIRVDFNVPLNAAYEITDDNRMRATIPTIKKILADGGSVILMSHLGRPKEGPTEKYSLKHLVKHLSQLLGGAEVLFADDCIGASAVNMSAALQPGQVLLLENLRFYKEEEKGDTAFAEKLSKLGDVYVNDAFGTAHRAHASTAVIAQFFSADKKMFGTVMDGEVASAEKVMHQSEKPFTAIIGGAKVSDKILIIENLLERATDIIIGGGMAYTFMKAQGGLIGNSLCEDDRLETAVALLKKAEAKGVCIHLPSDSVIADQFSADANTSTAPSNHIPDGWMGLDIGANACEQFANCIKRSKTILWNGPMGVFEMAKFQHGTKTIAIAVAEATANGAFSLVGGGDSVAAVNQFGFADKVSYVSTGGGAMLEYFEGKELPGIAAVKA